MRTKFEDAANIDDDVEQDNSIHHLHNPPLPPQPSARKVQEGNVWGQDKFPVGTYWALLKEWSD